MRFLRNPFQTDRFYRALFITMTDFQRHFWTPFSVRTSVQNAIYCLKPDLVSSQHNGYIFCGHWHVLLSPSPIFGTVSWIFYFTVSSPGFHQTNIEGIPIAATSTFFCFHKQPLTSYYGFYLLAVSRSSAFPIFWNSKRIKRKKRNGKKDFNALIENQAF